MNTHRSNLAVSFALITVLLSSIAHADVAPDPGPCDRQPEGSACVQSDGTAGVCRSHPDTRRPGRVWAVCERDEHECDHMAVGAACHGYLQHPAHCRQFRDDRTHRTWRACTVDDSVYHESGRTPAPPHAPDHASMLGCDVRSAGGTGGGALGLAVAFGLCVRRRRR